MSSMAIIGDEKSLVCDYCGARHGLSPDAVAIHAARITTRKRYPVVCRHVDGGSDTLLGYIYGTGKVGRLEILTAESSPEGTNP